jgi:hypothetical protein
MPLSNSEEDSIEDKLVTDEVRRICPVPKNQSIHQNQSKSIKINHTSIPSIPSFPSIPSIPLKKALVLILFVIVFNHKSNTCKYRFLAMKHPKVIGACLFTVWSVLEAMQTSVPT